MPKTPPGETRERVFRYVRERLLEGRSPTIRDVLSTDEVEDLDEEADRAGCMDAALGYLSYRARSRAELRRHLGRTWPPTAVHDTIGRCEELGYLDDRSFAEAFARDRIRLKPRGARRIVSELRGRGVSAEDAAAGVEAAFRSSERTESDLLDEVATRRWKALQARDAAVARRRLTSYLLRRGFSHGEVRAAVDRLCRDAD